MANINDFVDVSAEGDYQIEHVAAIDMEGLVRAVIDFIPKDIIQRKKFLKVFKVFLKHSMISNANGKLMLSSGEIDANGKKVMFNAYDYLTSIKFWDTVKSGNLQMKPTDLTPLRFCAALGSIIVNGKLFKESPFKIGVPGSVGHPYFGGILHCNTLTAKLCHIVALAYAMTLERTIIKAFPHTFFFRCLVNVGSVDDMRRLARVYLHVGSPARNMQGDAQTVYDAIAGGIIPATVNKDKVLNMTKEDSEFAQIMLALPVNILKMFGTKLEVERSVGELSNSFVPLQIKTIYNARVKVIKKENKLEEAKEEAKRVGYVGFNTDIDGKKSDAN